jgi:hypothetical protein
MLYDLFILWEEKAIKELTFEAFIQIWQVIVDYQKMESLEFSLCQGQENLWEVRLA